MGDVNATTITATGASAHPSALYRSRSLPRHERGTRVVRRASESRADRTALIGIFCVAAVFAPGTPHHSPLDARS